MMRWRFFTVIHLCHLLEVTGLSPDGVPYPPETSASTALVALKRARVGQLSEVASDKAQEEAQLLMRLSQECPQILRCFDFRLMPGTLPVLELMLEFAPLGDLSRRIRQHKEWCAETTEVAGMPEPEVVSYGSDIAAGLSYLHHLRPKILHRDIKPANILLFEQEVLPRAKLADFGIAKILELETSMAGAATVIGTPHYFAPELCRGEQYDERADAWALGCILYEMLCLHRPFHQAEGNLAVLAVRISEGKLDREALEKQAEHYNGVLILALTGLLCPSVEQRTRACDVLQSLRRLQAKVSNPEHSSMPASTEWWRTRQEDASFKDSEEEVKDNTWEGSSADSWRQATLAQLEGLLSQLQSDGQGTSQPIPEAEVTLGADILFPANEAGTADEFTNMTQGFGLGFSTPSTSRHQSPGLSPQEPRFGSEPATEYLGEMGFRCHPSPLTTPSSNAWSPPCRSAWNEAPTFGSPLGAGTPDTRPPTSPATRIFLRPLQRQDATRPREGKWHCSEISEDEVIFCFAPAEASPEVNQGHLGTDPPPPSPRASATMASGWQEVEIPKSTLRPEELPVSGIFALTSVT